MKPKGVASLDYKAKKGREWGGSVIESYVPFPRDSSGYLSEMRFESQLPKAPVEYTSCHPHPQYDRWSGLVALQVEWLFRAP